MSWRRGPGSPVPRSGRAPGRRLLALGGVLVAWTSTAQAPLLPREAVLALPGRISVQLSPSGAHLAWLALSPATAALDLWADLGGSPRVIVAADGAAGVQAFRWSGEARLVLERPVGGVPHVFSWDADAGLTDLTPWATGGARLLEAGADELLVTARRGEARWPDVYRVRVDRPTAPAVEVRTPGGVTRWLVDGAGAVRGQVVETSSGGVELRTRPGPRGRWQPLVQAGPEETVLPLGFTRDGTGLFLLTTILGDTERVVTKSLLTGQERVVAHEPRSDVVDVLGHPAHHELRAVAFVADGGVRWSSVDHTVTADLDAIDAAVEGDWAVVSADQVDQQWVVAERGTRGPDRFHRWDREKRRLSPLFDSTPELPVPASAAVLVPAGDGVLLAGQLLRPPRSAGLVIVWAGPPWRPSRSFIPLAALLADRGYAVLQLGLRTSAGQGKRFRAGRGLSRGPPRGPLDDVSDALRWAGEAGLAPEGKAAWLTAGGVELAHPPFTCAVDVGAGALLGPSGVGSGAHFPVRLERPAPRARRGAATIPVLRLSVDGAPAQVRYRGGPDGVLSRPDLLDLAARVEAFLGQCLGGRVLPLPLGGRQPGSSAVVADPP